MLNTMDNTANYLHTVKVMVSSFISDIEGSEIVVGGNTIKIDHAMFMGSFECIRHSDNAGHRGETIEEHTTEVYERAVKHCMATGDFSVLPMLALLHDLGKCYVCEWKPNKNKYVFKGHGAVSHDIARLVLEKTVPKRSLGNKEFTKLLGLVKYHDILQELYRARKRSKKGKGLKYIAKFAKTKLANEWFMDLCAFARCDSWACADLTSDTIEAITEDLNKYRRDEKG